MAIASKRTRPSAPTGKANVAHALTRARIVEAAIALLDAEGEAGLTFRALAARLSTGAGAIYWHVEDKADLLVAATDVVVDAALADDVACATPQEKIRAVAMGVFDTIDDHPWVGAQLARKPTGSSMLNVFERIGRAVQDLGVPPSDQFTSVSALVSYIIGVGSQNAANARGHAPDVTRQGLLEEAAAAWAALDAEAYPFTRAMAAPLRDHDDRAEFLAGIDLLLAGVAARTS